ncbi:hypothetical protein GCM10025857_09670 [Alicyclobacillus contaminans]|uniref:GNAT family N-acetyltransferase n=1 Tax=Alicyclobacillus contaminans TaxID=392016 RepID=UPI00041A94F3|nr:GNAT family N-acetyltransferase [Alicyclobacillus contaminans]GMA49610.1 hypothetical protein GCM10025857_09670 [Alicyclobacillus contaminans]
MSKPGRKSRTTPRAKGKKTAKSVAVGEAKPTAPLRFRPRSIEDDDFIVELTESQLATVHQQAFGQPFPRAQFRQYLQSGAPTVVVEQGDRRIGYYSYLVNPDGTMHISAMVIDPKHQASGIGSKVMRHLEEEALRMGVHTLEVYVQTGNEKSLSFTRKLGFTEAYPVTPTTLCFRKSLRAANAGQTPSPRAMSQPIPPEAPWY